MVRAPAKINLSLLVAGMRDDGFHEIETLMAKVTLFDEVLIEQGAKEGIELVCRGPCWAPLAQENLVHRACKLLLERSGVRANIKVTLTKNIPAGSGLGSASSDAAAALMGVNSFLKLDLDQGSLRKFAALLGSDTVFFLNGPLALCTGRGERIRRLDQIFDFLAVLVLPDVNISTKKVYENYRHEPAVFRRLRAEIKVLIEKNRIDLVRKMCANMLERTCFALYKDLAELKRTIESSGIGPVCLSGSGSAMFSIIENGDNSEASRQKHKLEEIIGCKSVIVSNNRW